MAALWTDDHRFATWFTIEALVCEAQAEKGQVPKDAGETLRTWRTSGKTCWNVARIHAIEAEVQHDVIAFLTNVAEHIGPHGQFLHLGMTSSDLLDTALALTLRDATLILIEDIDIILQNLKEKALLYKYTPMIGRSHGIFAEPITLGVKWAGFYSEFLRHKERLLQALDTVSVCSLSGPVGTYGHIDPEIEKTVAENLNLKIEPVATQIIPRDRHAHFISTLALIAGGIERFSTEIRLLQQSEINEVLEPFGSQQKGSSSMPHKRNPVLSENLTGLARMIRSAVVPALENITLWHERDISHSSVERFILPQTTILSDFALHRMAHIIKNMNVNTHALEENLHKSLGLYASGPLLLHLTQKNIPRDEAYRIVQKIAQDAWNQKKPLSELFRSFCLSKSKELSTSYEAISYEECASLFDTQAALKHVDTIFTRLGL
jgi:adenylosuccinate lyase